MAIYEIVLNALQQNNAMLSVLHYDVTGGDPPDWEDMAQSIYVHLQTHLLPFVVSGVVFTGITVRPDIEGSVGVTIDFPDGSLVGGDSDDGAASQTAMLVKKNTLQLTRPTQGRIFQGGISSQYIGVNGLWQTAARTAVNDFWDAMQDFGFEGPSNAAMVVKAANPTAPNTNAYNYVQQIVTSGVPVVQRRRKIGAGS